MAFINTSCVYKTVLEEQVRIKKLLILFCMRRVNITCYVRLKSSMLKEQIESWYLMQKVIFTFNLVKKFKPIGILELKIK